MPETGEPVPHMRAPANEFREYLAPGESVVDAGTGTLLDDSRRREGSIGVTDRRVLFVAEDGGYVDVAQSCISSIRSHPRTTVSSEEARYRLVAAAGALLAVAAVAGAAVLTASALGTALFLVGVGGFVLAEHVRRSGPAVVWTTLEWVRERLPGRPRVADPGSPDLGGFDRLGVDLGGLEGLRGRMRDAGELDERELLTFAFGGVGLAALIGPVALAASLAVLPLALVALGGVGLADYAYRRERVLARDAGSRQREQEVSIHLADGRIVRLRVDAAGRIDRALSRRVGEERRASADATSPQL